MDKILIVDGDVGFLEQTKSGLEKVRQFEVLTAAEGRQAVALLSDHRVSVLAADIETPGIDALELLSHMSHKHPRTPCIVMNDRGKPWFKKRISQQSFLYHLEKPFQIGALMSAVFVGLTLRDEGADTQGMTMASLLPLLELQQKTCRMQVRGAGKRTGFLYFEKGEIIDAHCGTLSVQDAARQIASWNRISFAFSDLPRRRTRKVETRDFQAIAVADAELSILSVRQAGQSPDTGFWAEKLADFFKTAAPAAKGAALGPVSGLTLHGETGVLVVQQMAARPGQDPLWALVLCEPGCNWYFVKTCLESLV